MKTSKEFLKGKKIWLGTKVADMRAPEKHYDLEELMEEFASQSPWISVEDRLPELSERVMCHDDVVDMYFDAIYNGGMEFFMKVQVQFIKMRVSSWMPLPTPPTK